MTIPLSFYLASSFSSPKTKFLNWVNYHLFFTSPSLNIYFRMVVAPNTPPKWPTTSKLLLKEKTTAQNGTTQCWQPETKAGLNTWLKCIFNHSQKHIRLEFYGPAPVICQKGPLQAPPHIERGNLHNKHSSLTLFPKEKVPGPKIVLPYLLLIAPLPTLLPIKTFHFAQALQVAGRDSAQFMSHLKQFTQLNFGFLTLLNPTCFSSIFD